MPGTVGDLGEFGLIAEITAGLPSSQQVVVGPGDDCAVFTPSGAVAVSTDTMVQGRHWRDSWSSGHDVGRKAVASSVADLEAEGARPLALVMSLALPAETEMAWVREFSAGVREECVHAGVLLVGGDTTSAPAIVVTSTVFGELAGRAPVTRAGARPGDVVAVRGRLGWAEAGLAVLNRGFRSPAAVVLAHRVPSPPYGQGIVAAEAGATAMVDVSDGLLADLGHIAAASGVAIDLDKGAFAIAEPQTAVAAALGGRDPLAFVLTGGDDHALAACFPRGPVPDGWQVIGAVRAGEPTVLVDGETWDGDPGWQHFVS
ncbi:MAG: thiamine-phosphate kinase [Propionicimonas sp.]|uniref:thiamine-phosphate kinase n=1 Tax=Propionicimonas sp. TaxID=1955623 RepID=UPI002B1F3041|nr:thiamine-phosphate kinase [Propionicimonas sp.]MEA4943709.1 thiamine-phosphate kinase [Propionicimonas sp.]MEA5052540.1 thiamine-phosphate kinase [Propionicimonas sp.]